MEVGAGFSVGRVAYNHNMRIGELSKNVDPERVKDNIVLIDELKGMSIEEYTNLDMQQYIDEYNVGKKPCRQIKTNYCDWHKGQKRYQQGGPIEFAAEAVLSYGSMHDIGAMYEDPKTRQKIYEESKELFEKWVADIQRKYKHIKILYAVCHYDEKTPHMHLCYTFRATEYQRGIPCQVCCSRALEQDGVEKIKDPKSAIEAGGFQQARFYKQFRHEVMNPDLERLGYTIKQEKNGINHIDSRVYGELMQAAEQEVQEIIEAAEKKAEAIDVLHDESLEIERIEHTPVYDPTQVKKIPVKQSLFSQSEIMVQMPVEVFDSLRRSADVKELNRRTEEKIKAHKEAVQKAVEAAMSNREKDLQKEVNDLKVELADAKETVRRQEIIIKQKETMIDRLTSILREIKEFLRDRGLLRIFEQTLERGRSR